MVSDASKKKAAQKKAAAAAKRGGKSAAVSASSKATAAASDVDQATNSVAELIVSDRTCTGVLCSHPLSRDIRIESLSLNFHGHDLIVDSILELNYGRRYGLLGLNGCGKSTLLAAIGCRELPIPEHMDILQGLGKNALVPGSTRHDADPGTEYGPDTAYSTRVRHRRLGGEEEA